MCVVYWICVCVYVCRVLDMCVYGHMDACVCVCMCVVYVCCVCVYVCCVCVYVYILFRVRHRQRHHVLRRQNVSGHWIPSEGKGSVGL